MGCDNCNNTRINTLVQTCEGLIAEHEVVLRRFSSDGIHIISYDIMQAIDDYIAGGTTTRVQIDALTTFYNLGCTLPPCTLNWVCELPLNGYESDGCGNRRLNIECNPITELPPTEAGMGGILILGLGIGIIYFMLKSKK